ncbi:MAG: type IX secretion system outer membrane channel protein PorV, partial [Bacteroidota bacterium]|nr:type IX secretion system outer membrane channel protein PorV [Bacteroidota bacterium]
MRKYLTFVVAALIFISLENRIYGQVTSNGSNVITTAVPFLTIAPESRGGAMGDAGVAISPDVNSLYWNPAKYAFIESEAGVSLSYTPWMRKLVGDMNLAYLVGYRKLDDQQTVSGGMRYFSLGQITFRNDAGESQGMQNPNEFAIDFGYTRLLSDKFSGSVALRYIHSDLGTSMTGTETLRPGNAFAADVSFYYQQELKSDRYKNLLSAGVDISNIGSKISYGDGTKYFIPTNLRMGVAYSSEI